MPVFAVTTAEGTNWDPARGNREQAFWDEHADFMDGLVERGVVILGGPIGGGDADDIALLAVEAPDEDALRPLFAADPWIVNQVYRLKRVQPWTIWLDGRPRVPGPATDADAGGVPQYATDLFRGAAAHYDRYRLPYPQEMLGELVMDADVSGLGRLLDLACGTGQLAFPLRSFFAEVWAVDQEPDMVQLVQQKADQLGAVNVRGVIANAETLDAEPGHFELAVIGNAFHRLNRDLVAARLSGWLRPGGHVALCWSSGPRERDQPWQRAFNAMVERWQEELGAADRVPANWAGPSRQRPDSQVMSDAGFQAAGRREFTIEHAWSVATLAGYVRSTSYLTDPVLGDRGAEFDADLAATLAPFAVDGAFRQTVSYACDLYGRYLSSHSG
jgi:SAM-dependent methyltransferase